MEKKEVQENLTTEQPASPFVFPIAVLYKETKVTTQKIFRNILQQGQIQQAAE